MNQAGSHTKKVKPQGGFCNTDCKSMYDMGIPLEKGEWLGLGYLMRTISFYKGMTANEKGEIQKRLLQAFKESSYKPENYSKVMVELEELHHNDCQEKMDGLEDIVDGMSDVIAGLSKDVSGLANKQAVGISEMDTTADKILSNIKSNRPPSETLELVSKLKSNCKDVLKNVNDMQTILEEKATFDPLTKLYNRRAFDSKLQEAVEQFKKDQQPFSLVFSDVDHFKKFNDKFGHRVGDQVLAAVSGEIRSNIRGGDIAARYGGEEICIIYANLKLEEARKQADIIREAIANHDFLIRGEKEIVQITASFGVTECRPEWLNMPVDDICAKLVEESDAAVYKAKEAGRNRVCVAK